MGKQPFKVASFMKTIAHYIREGRIKLDKNKIKGMFPSHDPGQLARNGGVIEEARYIISHLTDDFVELTPNRKYNWCCGGCGGLIAIGEKGFGMKSAKIKSEQAKATNIEILITTYESCHTQLLKLNEHYKLGTSEQSLAWQVVDALTD